MSPVRSAVVHLTPGHGPAPRELWSTLTPAGVLGAPGVPGRLLPGTPTRLWPDHLHRYGPVPDLAATDLIALAEAARLTGRGGGAFPTGRKIAAVLGGIRTRRRAVVVANCCDGDPTTGKDSALLAWSPHLVIDGAVLLGSALSARRVAVAVRAGSAGERFARAAVRLRAADNSFAATDVEVLRVPTRFVASEATSLVNLMNTGDARPLGRLDPIWRRGVDGGPTLVVNAETLATLALLARFGVDWHGRVGLPDEPGTVVVTVGGAVPRPTVVEVAVGTPIGQLLAAAGAVPAGDALVGGLAGSWVDLGQVEHLLYSTTGLQSLRARRGVGSITVLPAGGCLLIETARISRYLAEQSAGQCGPCMFGLPALAADCDALARGDAGALDRLRGRLPVVNGRGGCSHPDGAVSLVGSALTALTGRRSEHLSRHLHGGGCGAPAPTVRLPAVGQAAAPAPADPQFRR